MAFSNGPKPIVTEGLLFYSDPLNYRSYNGTVSRDLVNQNISGSLINTTHNGFAYSIDGTDDLINWNADFKTTQPVPPVTVTWWFKHNTITAQSGYYFRFDTEPGGVASNYYGYLIGIGQASKNWIISFGTGTGNGSQHRKTLIGPTDIWTLGEWTFGTAVFISPTTPLIKIYKNGEVVSGGTYSGTGTTIGWSGAGNNVASSGADNTQGSSDFDLGPLAVYDRELTQTEIKTIYEATRDRFGI
jgi:hypothetical protein